MDEQIFNETDLNDKLLTAISNNNIDQIKSLLNDGADIHFSNDFAFKTACDRKQIEFARYLLDLGANPNACGQHDGKWGNHFFDYAPLIYHSELGNIDIVRFLLAEANVDVHMANDCALIEACRNDHSDIVSLLLDYGANMYAQNGCAITITAENGYINILKILIDKGFDINLENYNILNDAVKYGHFDFVKLLLEIGITAYSEFITACQKGHYRIVKLLMEHGVDLHNLGNEALVMASTNGHTDIVKLLIENGVDIHIKNYMNLDDTDNNFINEIHTYTNIKDFSEAPLFSSVYFGHVDVVKVLIEHGADIHVHYGSILLLAAARGWIDIVRILIGIGEFSQKIINRALHYSANNRKPVNQKDQIFNFLLESGADFKEIMYYLVWESAIDGDLDYLKMCFDNGVHEQNIKDPTLITAIYQNQTHLIKYLLDIGANPNYDNALTTAIKNNNYDITKLLVEAGANVCIDNTIALKVALEFDHIDAQRIIDLLIKHGAHEVPMNPSLGLNNLFKN